MLYSKLLEARVINLGAVTSELNDLMTPEAPV